LRKVLMVRNNEVKERPCSLLTGKKRTVGKKEGHETRPLNAPCLTRKEKKGTRRNKPGGVVKIFLTHVRSTADSNW